MYNNYRHTYRLVLCNSISFDTINVIMVQRPDISMHRFQRVYWLVLSYFHYLHSLCTFIIASWWIYCSYIEMITSGYGNDVNNDDWSTLIINQHVIRQRITLGTYALNLF